MRRHREITHTTHRIVVAIVATTMILIGVFIVRPSIISRASADTTGLHIQGNIIVNSQGQTMRLSGVNNAGGEYECRDDWGFFDGPDVNDVPQSFVDGLKSWNVRAIRVPLNEHCWLDIASPGRTGTIPANRRGAIYRQKMTAYVNLLTSNGIVPIISDFWHAPGLRRTENNPMPNRDHSPAFWTSVAQTFGSNSSVVFELLNEPHPDNNQDTPEAWRCWRDGGDCQGVVDRADNQPYTSAGMQELVTAIRQAGASNVIIAPGVQYSNNLAHWLENKPVDPLGNIAAGWHVYDFNLCKSAQCYQDQVAPVAAVVPVVATEVGTDEQCLAGQEQYLNELFTFMNSHNMGWLAWTYNASWQSPCNMNIAADWNGGARDDMWSQRVHAELANSVIPTSGPTYTPTPSSASPTPEACLSHILGDCNGDGRVTLTDFEVWRRAYLNQL